MLVSSKLNMQFAGRSLIVSSKLEKYSLITSELTFALARLMFPAVLRVRLLRVIKERMKSSPGILFLNATATLPLLSK